METTRQCHQKFGKNWSSRNTHHGQRMFRSAFVPPPAEASPEGTKCVHVHGNQPGAAEGESKMLPACSAISILLHQLERGESFTRATFASRNPADVILAVGAVACICRGSVGSMTGRRHVAVGMRLLTTFVDVMCEPTHDALDNSLGTVTVVVVEASIRVSTHFAYGRDRRRETALARSWREERALFKDSC